MQLTYRGLTYDHCLSQAETPQELGLTGCYRGLNYHFRRTGGQNVIRPNAKLTYRGRPLN